MSANKTYRGAAASNSAFTIYALASDMTQQLHSPFTTNDRSLRESCEGVREIVTIEAACQLGMLPTLTCLVTQSWCLMFTVMATFVRVYAPLFPDKPQLFG